MDISQSRVQVSLPTLTAFNATNPINIKGFRASSEADVIYTDEGGATHTVAMLKGETLQVQGKIEIDVTNPQALLIFL